jgi:MFS family permease
MTPLGERSRGSRWAVTVAWFVAGSVLGGAAAGALFGWLGSVVLGPWPGRVSAWSPWVLAGLLAVGVAVDARILGARLPSVRRQVNEQWLHQYRGWVYGIGFGVQLGMGFVTIVTTSAVYVAFAAGFLSASAWGGALIGGCFGLVRAASIFATARVLTADRLARVDGRLRRWEVPATAGARGVQAGLAVAIVAVAVLG